MFSAEVNTYNYLLKPDWTCFSFRRNLVTEGVRLNDLVGKTFKIGQVECRGIELCEPCKVMARHFPATSLSQSDIIRAFTDKGGIRVEVLGDGVVKLGDGIFW
jgi:MOSC domain-containing protein YiiM